MARWDGSWTHPIIPFKPIKKPDSCSLKTLPVIFRDVIKTDYFGGQTQLLLVGTHGRLTPSIQQGQRQTAGHWLQLRLNREYKWNAIWKLSKQSSGVSLR